MTKLLMLADDLTGALDTGVFFARLGASVSIDGESGALRALNTRHLSPEDALSRTLAAIESEESDYLYLKTDSLLRGHIGTGLEAAVKARGTVFFAPAYPANGRTVKDGVAYLYGTRLTETEAAQDVRNPIKHDTIAEIIAEESALPVKYINPGEAPDADFHGVIVCGAETDAELDLAAKAALDAGIKAFAGCAGFARALSRALELDGKEEALTMTAGRLLVVSASANPATLEQLTTARSLGIPGTWLYDGGHSEEKLEEAVNKARRFAKGEPCSMLAAAFSDLHCRKNNNTIKAMHLNPEEGAELIVRETAQCAARVLSRAAAMPFVIGGDTLKAFCEETGIVSLSPRASLAPGIIYCLALDKRGREKGIITKAGSFGDASCIVDLADGFRG